MDVLEEYVSRNLKIIGKIDLNSKIIIRNGNIYIEQGFFGLFIGPKRWIMGDDRYNTIDFIKTLIHQAFLLSDNFMEKLKHYSDEGYSIKLKHIKEDLEHALQGILHMKDTYKHDATIHSMIEVLHQSMVTTISKIDFSLHPPHSNSSLVPT